MTRMFIPRSVFLARRRERQERERRRRENARENSFYTAVIRSNRIPRQGGGYLPPMLNMLAGTMAGARRIDQADRRQQIGLQRDIRHYYGVLQGGTSPLVTMTGPALPGSTGQRLFEATGSGIPEIIRQYVGGTGTGRTFMQRDRQGNYYVAGRHGDNPAIVMGEGMLTPRGMRIANNEQLHHNLDRGAFTFNSRHN